MSKTVVALIAFAGGIGVGLIIAKQIVTSKVQGDLDSALAGLGLGGGAVQSFADKFVTPALVN